MNAKEKAEKYLSSYSESYRNSVDPLIKPLCQLLTDHDYITLHSCSGHVKVVRHPNGSVYKKYKWYITFVSSNSISRIRNILQQIENNENIYISLEKSNILGDLTKVWVMRLKFNYNYSDTDLSKTNRIIFNAFKNNLS